MSRITDRSFSRQHRGGFAAASHRLIIAAMFLSFFAAAPAFSQMSYGYSYSDAWVDSSNPNIGYIVGTGVTEDSYNSYGHTYKVNTRITSPDGRTASAESYGYSSPYARVDAVLPWNPDLPFDRSARFNVFSDHYATCPGYYNYGGGNRYLGGTSAYIIVGFSVNLMVRAEHYNTYTLVDAACSVLTCRKGYYESSSDRGRYIQYVIPVGGFCLDLPGFRKMVNDVDGRSAFCGDQGT